MGVTEIAGVVPQDHWNNAAGATNAAPLPLVDQTGAATGATATWSSDHTWMTPIAGGAGDLRMMKGYLDSTSSSSTTVTVAGLARRTYDVYVYADGDNRTYTRSAAYTISDPSFPSSTMTVTDSAGVNFSGAFVEGRNTAGNYVKFTITATAFTITAVPSAASTTTQRAPINAVQIVPVPTTARAAISVDFTGTSTTTLTSSDVAGAVGVGNWNSAGGTATTTPLPLVDETGAASGATVVWNSSGAWALPIASDTPDRTMMKGYLDTSSTGTTTVAVSGLALRTYDVYVYADGDNRSYTRSAAYTISGPGLATTTIQLTDVAGTNFSATFSEAQNGAGNYVRFTVTASSFTLTAKPTTGTNLTLRAPINALQIVPR
jgi:hypothetical protein